MYMYIYVCVLWPVNAAAFTYLSSPPLEDWMWARYASPVPKYLTSSWLFVPSEHSFVDKDLAKPLPTLLDAILERYEVRWEDHNKSRISCDYGRLTKYRYISYYWRDSYRRL